MRTLAIFALMLALVSMAVAADVDGNWTGERPGRDGNVMKVTFKFKAEGSTLTGSTTMRDNEVPISNGKISGNDVSFDVKMEFGGNAMVMKYSGTVSGGEMKLKMTREGSDRTVEMTLKKS